MTSNIDCYDRKVESQKDRYSNDQPMQQFLEAANRAIEKSLQDIEEDLEMLECFGKEFSSFRSVINELDPSELLEPSLSKYRSQLFTKNLVFTNTLSDVYKKFVQGVNGNLASYPISLRDQLLTGIGLKIADRLQAIVEGFLKELQAIAIKLHVQNYSITVGTGLVQFTLTFGVPGSPPSG